MDAASYEWSRIFPRLFADSYVDYAAARTFYVSEVPPEHLVSRLHLVAVTDDSRIVVCRSEQGWRFLPGGTREPEESLHELARRELVEEAGATLLGDLLHFSGSSYLRWG